MHSYFSMKISQIMVLSLALIMHWNKQSIRQKFTLLKHATRKRLSFRTRIMVKGRQKRNLDSCSSYTMKWQATFYPRFYQFLKIFRGRFMPD